MTEPSVVRSVVRFLGLLAIILCIGDIVLVREIIHQGAGAGTVDPAAVAALSGVGTLAGAAVAALGALLVSTRSGPPEPPAAPVAVEVHQPDGEPVPVDAVGD